MCSVCLTVGMCVFCFPTVPMGVCSVCVMVAMGVCTACLTVCMCVQFVQRWPWCVFFLCNGGHGCVFCLSNSGHGCVLFV